MKHDTVTSILLAGVGGQGAILVSRILTRALIGAGYDVKMSEIHGMAQRGGSVSTTVRYGKKVEAPLIGRGGADILLAFEEMEAVRWSPWLKADGLAIVNAYRIRPLPVAAGTADYPDHCLDALSAVYRTLSLDAGNEAIRLGNARVMNTVMLGALAAHLGPELDWEGALKEELATRLLQINRQAFEAGLRLATGRDRERKQDDPTG